MFLILQVGLEFLGFIQQVFLILVSADEHFMKLLVFELVEFNLGLAQLTGAEQAVKECVGGAVTDVLDAGVEGGTYEERRESERASQKPNQSGESDTTPSVTSPPAGAIIRRIAAPIARFWLAACVLVPLMLGARPSKVVQASESEGGRRGGGAEATVGCNRAQ